MKTAVLIIGTNATGKTTLCRRLMDMYGGVTCSNENLTLVGDKRVSFIGNYSRGCDELDSLRKLREISKEAFKEHDAVIAEGFCLCNIGICVTDFMFSFAESCFVVNLWAKPRFIYNRLISRSGYKERCYKKILINKQRECFNAAKKWIEIGVNVLRFNVEEVTNETIATEVYNEITRLINL